VQDLAGSAVRFEEWLRESKFKTGRLVSASRKGNSTMSILAWIVLGLLAGFIGSKIVNKTGEGVFLDIILGIVGAIDVPPENSTNLN
jgi:hypothetical protein